MTDYKSQYEKLKASGMMWEFHPDYTGEWELDKAKFIAQHQPKPPVGYYFHHHPEMVREYAADPIKPTPVCHITEAVKADMDEATRRGYAEYGVTLDRQDLSLLDWMKHIYEETLDKAKYLKKAITLMENEVGRND